MTLQSIKTSTVQRKIWMRKLQAFVVVALAVFLIVSLIWPLSVNRFMSKGQIEIEVAKTPQAQDALQTLLTNVLPRHTSPDALAQLADHVLSQVPSNALTNLSQTPDFATRFGAQLQRSPTNGKFSLDVTYQGNGTQAENFLTHLLTTNIARDLLASPHAQLGTGKPINRAVYSRVIDENEAATQSLQLSQQATFLLTRIDSQLNGRSPSTQDGRSTSNSPFHSASHRTQSLPENTTGQDITALKETVSELSNLVKEAGNGPGFMPVSFSVTSVKGRTMQPVNGAPKLPHMVLLSLFSVLIAATVAAAYHPLEDKGFHNIDHVTNKLGVPVVATLGDASQKTNPEESWFDTPLANQVVHVAEITLFAITVIAASFCIFNPDIRAAFANNIYHGFARIFWMFTY